MLMTNANTNRLLFLILGGSREQFDLWSLSLKFNYCDTPRLKPFKRRNPFMYTLPLSLSLFLLPPFYSRFSQCPHCGLAAGGATTLSAISSQVLIWPLMGLDELGASLYRERGIHRTGRVERTSLLSLIRSSFLQCTFLPVSPQLSLHHSNW